MAQVTNEAKAQELKSEIFNLTMVQTRVKTCLRVIGAASLVGREAQEVSNAMEWLNYMDQSMATQVKEKAAELEKLGPETPAEPAPASPEVAPSEAPTPATEPEPEPSVAVPQAGMTMSREDPMLKKTELAVAP